MFLCVATEKGEAKAASESGCVRCYMDAVEHSGSERLKSIRSGPGKSQLVLPPIRAQIYIRI